MNDGGPNMAPALLSVIIPVYNEQQTIGELLRRVDAVAVDKQLVIVDDASSDGTAEVLDAWARRADVCLLRHERNLGKGAALRTGLAAATGRLVIFQDGDLEYDPADYPRLIEPILAGEADAVYGTRFLRGMDGAFFTQWLANRLFTLLFNLWMKTTLNDVETCYKLFRREVISAIEIEQPGFGVDPEVTAKALRSGRPEGGPLRLHERPIRFTARRYAEGKKITLRDGLRSVWCILRYGGMT